MIIISFEDQQLYETCVSLQRAEQAYGTVTAAALVTFISDAQAFENVGELIDFHGDDEIIFLADSLSVAIGSEYRATLVVVGKRYTRDGAGNVVWPSVTRLKLVEISRH